MASWDGIPLGKSITGQESPPPCSNPIFDLAGYEYSKRGFPIVEFD